MKLAGEYCWAITQAVERSYCHRSGSRVLEFGFQLDSLLYACVIDHMPFKFRLAQNSTCVLPSGTQRLCSLVVSVYNSRIRVSEKGDWSVKSYTLTSRLSINSLQQSVE